MNDIEKQLMDTLTQLDDELKRKEPSNTRLEFFYRKIAILEAHLD